MTQILHSSSEGRQEKIAVLEGEACTRCGGEVSEEGAYCSSWGFRVDKLIDIDGKN